MSTYPLYVSGINVNTPYVPTVTAPSPAWFNMPPTTTGMLVAGSGLVLNTGHNNVVFTPGITRPLLNMSGWSPTPNEFEIWIAPAGWAEAAYLNGERIDGEDPLSFLDKLEGVDEVNIRVVYHDSKVVLEGGGTAVVAGKPHVILTIGGIINVNKHDKYSQLFPSDGTRRDIVLQATSPLIGGGNNQKKLKHAHGVIANAILIERELSMRGMGGDTYEAVTIMADAYFPIVEN